MVFPDVFVWPAQCFNVAPLRFVSCTASKALSEVFDNQQHFSKMFSSPGGIEFFLGGKQ